MCAVITSLLVAAVCFYRSSATCHLHLLQFFFFFLKVPIFLTCSERVGVNLMRVLTVPCLSVHEQMERGARVLDCLSVCKSLNGRVRGHKALDKLSVFREWLRWLSNGRQSGLSAATCQSGPTCPTGKQARREKTGSAVSCLCLTAVYLNTGHLVLVPSMSLMSGPIQRLIHPITAVCTQPLVTLFFFIQSSAVSN